MSDPEESLEEKLRKFRLGRESTNHQTVSSEEQTNQGDMSNRQGIGGGPHGTRHPPHLKGRDIGKFYANLRRVRDTKRDQDGSNVAGYSQSAQRRQRQKNREKMAYENGEGGRDANRFKAAGDFREDEAVLGGDGGRPPPGLQGRELGLYYRDRMTKKRKEMEKRKVVDITIPRWQIQEIREQLNLNGDRENVDFFKHFVQSDEINSVFKNEYLRVIKTSLHQILLEESRKVAKTPDQEQIDHREKLNEQLYQDFLQKRVLSEIRAARERLPAYKHRHGILGMIDTNQVILIKGETGSGKTTQVPQFILDRALFGKNGSTCRIICTQPRRISAITLAERVAVERGERLGQSVGYQIRLDAKRPRPEGGSIMFCTTGIVLTIMQKDPYLRDYSHLILDEIHERDVLTDLLLGIVKMILKFRKDLKVILMSATLTADTFSKYFDGCPIAEIEGIMFPVQEFYLEDIIANLNYYKFGDVNKRTPRNRKFYEFDSMIRPYVESIRGRYPVPVLRAISNPESESSQNDLIVHLIVTITCSKPEGAILVFAPSLAQISELHKLLSNHSELRKHPTLIYALHSKVPQLDQKAVFERPAYGTRKIILSTNIAETSITINDVVYVINTGKHKINMHNNGISSLCDQWTSISNEIQRKGRAGRVQPGACFHLYTRGRRKTLLQNTPPEILRVSLEEVILNIKILCLGEVTSFLGTLLDRPTDAVIRESLELLNRLNAIDDDQTLTPLGYHLARLPMDPHTGKMVLLSGIFSCTDPITSIAASLSFKDAFYKPFNKERQVHAVRLRFAEDSHSDHLMLANVIDQWKSVPSREVHTFANRNFLNLTILNQLYSMKRQFCEYLHTANLLQEAQANASCNNENSDNRKLLTAIIGAGLYPNVAFVRKVIRKRTSADGRVILHIEGQGRATMHPCSVNSKLSDYESNFVVYYEKKELSALTIFDTTVVNPFPLFFFGDNHVTTEGAFEYISIAGHDCLKCNKETYQLIQDLRGGFNLFLQKKICEPTPVDWSSEEGTLLRAIIKLITIDGKYEDDFDDDDLPMECSGNPEEIPLDDYDQYDYFDNDELPPAASTSGTSNC
ncbi:ATP-dependent DNA/RNA helicase DHX36 [Toxorhynchites rutilus septentrionalis]|uniref:ATP-dependent DNA/RNA helicase DHX36 n=1 Tax=Toxorhynchites rutilus septentrionalis TaxID=329112 RepID=UPI002478858F|nr:ATP-dependent DNA/RNA helicase DHX36 [Toxorhynchites rutilus septentrionalis]